MKLEKATKDSLARVKRQYDDACGLAHALDLIGERWALLVLRELAYGARRFSELKADLPGISANVLTQRLTDLEVRGLVRRTKLPPPASVQVYEATPWGLEAAPLIRALGKWAARSPWHDTSLSFSPISAMMSMETMFDADRAGDLAMTLSFVLNGTAFAAEVRDGEFRAWRGVAPASDVKFEGEPRMLAGILYGGAPFEVMSVTGDLTLAARFADIFELPPKVDAPLPG
ncbi:helix-turn-helix transcriptional regulator [Sphingomonas piscis]|uniref:Helix-turn-helix transcriptional regulator n=1 Tax=Sphingomonas piscis TaxID=2714943 RepID=A0A6G7YQE2_9SPHN|nr:helix-turn-helix domain-containing protein [Sphingomonas piscis]QIK78965.1 helix-turn-helix transcriptional regulator [Sphingomonas piscis]